MAPYGKVEVRVVCLYELDGSAMFLVVIIAYSMVLDWKVRTIHLSSGLIRQLANFQ